MLSLSKMANQDLNS